MSERSLSWVDILLFLNFKISFLKCDIHYKNERKIFYKKEEEQKEEEQKRRRTKKKKNKKEEEQKVKNKK